MTARYRPVEPSDLPALRRVQLEAAQALLRSEGRDPSRFRQWPGVPPEAHHVLRHDPGCCWLAEVDGEPAAYATGFVRASLWYLSNLFVRPSVHNQGLGKELLRRSMDGGRAAGAREFAVLSSSYRSAQSLYLRAGMAARFPVYVISGPASALLSLPSGPRRGWTLPADSEQWLQRLRLLDEQVWGKPRDVDQRFGLANAHCIARQERSGVGGYVYVREDGRVGPLAASEPEAQLPLLRRAAEWLLDHSDEPPRLQVPGVNLSVLQPLLEGGFTVDTINVLMSSAPFGQFDRYVISGGVLL